MNLNYTQRKNSFNYKRKRNIILIFLMFNMQDIVQHFYKYVDFNFRKLNTMWNIKFKI